MKTVVLIILGVFTSLAHAQDDETQKQALLAQKKANSYVYEANSLMQDDDFVSAEMAYRKALSEQPEIVAGVYNLGSSYIKKGNFEEALYRLQQAAKSATDKSEKHKAFHNIGNVLMENKKCKEAVEAYKSALRNDPTDEETRYNLGLAKVCAEKQKDEDQQDQNDNDQENKDNQDQQKDKENKENQDNKDQGDNKEDENKDKNDQGDQDKKDGDDKKDEQGKPKEENEDKGEGEKEQQPQQPRKGQMSPQQIKNLLEAMNNQEQKVQEKMNAEKVKGVKVKTEKDW
ncbi:tetratricopeptide repeat protein [Aestuariibaculum sediminum]|uniref:Tetratricopeptide repeat protein n=1 Tax=Aestuariibaculum sediminum TaxID=2770637 RepID=A0A8J6Q1H2_9FLAO|nr:tetratricopeptide repeat protein [Aestuariibaculum sediminum]MBD0831109.1 tetratricopeptide repeat protein [Aestuariibaculum sediminum]